MKLRIKGNSLRIRLSKTEVKTLTTTGYLEEQTLFGNTSLVYALQKTGDGQQLSATFEDNKITMWTPEKLISGWADNNVVGFEGQMPVGTNVSLYLLLEKDFVCLDETQEDQSDNYENPGKNC